MWLWIFLFPLTVLAQSGFYNIDCGGKKNHTDDNELFWTPDDAYISTGITFSAGTTTLRYFPGPVLKHCYEFPVINNRKYLVGTYFNYSNYDGLKSVPTFSLQIDGNTIRSIMSSFDDENYYEHIVDSTGDYLFLCLARTSSNHVPYISRIQLILLDDGMYNSTFYGIDGALEFVKRINVGGDGLRYPSDAFDRYWSESGDKFSGYANLSLKLDESIVQSYKEKAPLLVWQTAVTSSNSINFTFDHLAIGGYLFFFYFAENSDAGFRNFSLQVNDYSTSWSLGGSETWIEIYNLKTLYTSSVRISVSKINGSKLGPILNGFEMYHITENLLPGTYKLDLEAVRDVRSRFQLSNWSGDPCLPKGYGWDWVGCNLLQNPPRIVSLNLSNMGLTGVIPQGVLQLSELTTLSLENNDLSCIPQDQALKLKNVHMTGGFICGSNKRKSTVYVAATIPSVVALLVLCIASFYYRNAIRMWMNKFSAKNGSATRSPKEPPREFKKHSVARRDFLTYEEVVKATNNFKRTLGTGGFGHVFYGMLSDGREIGVKTYTATNIHATDQFNSEVDSLSIINHKNVVPFIGHCSFQSQLMLVYKYMENGSLSDWLYDFIRFSKFSVKLALGAAEGLDYLHSKCVPGIIHRDVKSSNILLDRDFIAKIGDFGLAKVYEHHEQTHFSTMIKGTAGYMDPEYQSTGKLTEKSDVFSFGVVLFELITGLPPMRYGQGSLTAWAHVNLSDGNLEAVVDAKLSDNYNKQAMRLVAQTAESCTDILPSKRPTMSTIVMRLKDSILLEESQSLSAVLDITTVEGR